MHTCPHCEKDLGDLNGLMNKLSAIRPDGKLLLTSPCCKEKILAYCRGGRYFIAKSDETSSQMIGGA